MFQQITTTDELLTRLSQGNSLLRDAPFGVDVQGPSSTQFTVVPYHIYREAKRAGLIRYCGWYNGMLLWCPADRPALPTSQE